MKKLTNLKERIIKNFIENKVLFFACIIIWAILIITTLLFYKTSLGMDSVGPNDYTNVIEVNENTNIIQKLPVDNETNSLGIYFASYRRNNSGRVNVKVTGNDSNIVYVEKNINVDFLQDNAFKMFELSEALNSKKDKTITVELSSNSKKGKAIGIYYGVNKYNQEDELTINSNNINGTLVYRFMVKNETLNKFSNIVIISTITLLSLIIIWLLLYKPQLEYFFSVLVFVFGLIFMISISPSSPPDETIHYEYVLQESNLLMFNNDVNDVDHQYIDYVANNYYTNTVNNKKAYIEIIDNINTEYKPSHNVKAYDVSIDNTYKLQFVPQSIGVIISRIIGLNPIKTFYSGRLTNLLFYVICIFICIKMSPVHKTLLGVLASLPILIQQASSYSYDTFIIGLCFITIGSLFKMKFGEGKVKVFDYVIAFISCLLLAPAKYIYGFLALLYWLVPQEKYGSKIKKIIFSLILCAPMFHQLYPIFLSRIIYIFRHTILVNAEENGIVIVDENPLITMRYVVNNPIKIVTIVFTTIRYNLKMWFYGSIGQYLSQLTLILPSTLINSLLLVIISTIFIKEKISFNIITRIVLIAICIVIALFSIGGMLLSETHINDTYISGIQGRYYSPLLPYFFSSLTNNKINISKKYIPFIIFAYILIMFEIIVYILSYTFVI